MFNLKPAHCLKQRATRSKFWNYSFGARRIWVRDSWIRGNWKARRYGDFESHTV